MKIYADKHTLEFLPKAHRYKVDGEFKPGVTTILGVLGKDNLIQWSANMASEYWRDNYEDGTDRNAAHKLAKKAWSVKRDKAGDTGTKVHEYITAYFKGEEIEVTDDMAPSVRAFHGWLDKVKPEILESERPVYSESMGYCGTYDLRYKRLDGTIVMLDFKTGDPQKEFNEYTKRYTGRTRAYQEAFVQCAAYDLAYTEEFKTQAHAYEVVYITKSGELYDFLETQRDAYKDLWRSLVQSYKCLNKLKLNKEINPYV